MDIIGFHSADKWNKEIYPIVKKDFIDISDPIWSSFNPENCKFYDIEGSLSKIRITDVSDKPIKEVYGWGD